MLPTHTNIVCFWSGCLAGDGHADDRVVVCAPRPKMVRLKITTMKTVDGKVGKKAADAKEKRFQVVITEKADVDDAQKEIDDFVTKMSPNDKGRILTAMGVVDATPGTKSKYDHEDTTKRLISIPRPRLCLWRRLRHQKKMLIINQTNIR